jgi:predicted DNA-binding transcriptional regulator AlpA
LREESNDAGSARVSRMFDVVGTTKLGDQPRPGRHLTIEDVCAELAIARSTFYDWRAKGRGPRCIKLPNGSLRVRRSELDAWLASREDASAASA